MRWRMIVINFKRRYIVKYSYLYQDMYFYHKSTELIWLSLLSIPKQKLILNALVQKCPYWPDLTSDWSCKVPGIQQRRTATPAEFVSFRGRSSGQSIEEWRVCIHVICVVNWVDTFKLSKWVIADVLNEAASTILIANKITLMFDAEFFIAKCKATNNVQNNGLSHMQLWYIYGNCFWSQRTANIPILPNVAAFYTVFVISKDALVEKDQMIKEMKVLTQQNQLLQQSVDALQEDQAEKNKVSGLWQQGARWTVS